MSKLAILCVDDEPTVLESLRIELRRAFGKLAVIETADSGAEGLALIAECQQIQVAVAVIISDYLMPLMKGDEFLGRAHELAPESLKILLTGQATMEAITNTVNLASLYRFMPKPWVGVDLRLTVSEALNQFQSRQRLLQQEQQLRELTEKQQVLIEELSHLNRAYERFVPVQFLRLLGKKSIVEVELGDHSMREMSVMFCDIRDFTTVSEQMTPEDSFRYINAFLSRMEIAILESGGFVDKYLGDGIMALFDCLADQALLSAFAILHRLNIYNETRQRPERLPIRVGIGINTGTLMLGTIGSKKRMDGTVVSDSVNLAARLQELTKYYGVSILISEHTFSRLTSRDDYCYRLIDRVQVKGKQQAVTVYEIFDADPPHLCEDKMKYQVEFEQGVVEFHDRNYQSALNYFQQYQQLVPGDAVPQVYVERCQEKLRLEHS
ncbi:MAG: response regulator [Oscillatoriales cyanobacterium SM2_2_1]|nr:response regulator [Oscillatoriales cyanobacterium SM2_2_1]